MPEPAKHGGPRPNSGRKPLGPDKRVTFSGRMHPKELAKMRALQNGQPLGRFLVRKLGIENTPAEPPPVGSGASSSNETT